MSEKIIGACDCHAHIFGPRTLYPLSPDADYVPEESSIESYRTVLENLGINRCVLVQPSVYGTDNRCLLNALETMGSMARGVAVVDPDVSEEDLGRLHAAGVRGVRINTVSSSRVSLDMLEDLEKRIYSLGWHLQLLVNGETLLKTADRLESLHCPIVLDHFAQLDPSKIDGNPQLDRLLELLDAGRTWVKLSAPYLQGGTTLSEFRNFGALSRKLASAREDRLLWASDWPHPAFKGDSLDDRGLLDSLVDWIPDASSRRKILQDNPQSLYGFDPV